MKTFIDIPLRVSPITINETNKLAKNGDTIIFRIYDLGYVENTYKNPKIKINSNEYDLVNINEGFKWTVSVDSNLLNKNLEYEIIFQDSFNGEIITRKFITFFLSSNFSDEEVLAGNEDIEIFNLIVRQAEESSISETFLTLDDTPDSYTGKALKLVAVNETEDSLIFVDGGGAPIDAYTKTESDTRYNTKTEVDTKIGDAVYESMLTVALGGFVHNDNIEVVYDSINRTITLNTAIGLDAYVLGKKITALDGLLTWTSTPHPDIVGNYFLYHNGTNFVWSTSIWSYSYLQIAYVNYGSVNKFALRETHGLIMDPKTHEHLHVNIGTYLMAGGDLSNYVLNSTTPAQRRPDIVSAAIKDEDLKTDLPSFTDKLYSQRSLSGTAIRTIDINRPEIVNVNANQPYYNQLVGGNWVQTPMSNNAYQAIFVVAIPVSYDSSSQKYRYLFVQGQEQSTNLANIKAITPAKLVHGDSLVQEYVFIGKIIIRYVSNNWQIISVEKITGSKLNQVAMPAQSYLSNVAHDSSLSGSGTIADPLSVVITNIYTKSETDAKITAHDDNIDSHNIKVKWYRVGSPDANGIFTVIEFKREDNSLYCRTTLSGGTSPQYTTRTEQYYLADGLTLNKTITYTLSYDVDGNLISEV